MHFHIGAFSVSATTFSAEITSKWYFLSDAQDQSFMNVGRT